MSNFRKTINAVFAFSLCLMAPRGSAQGNQGAEISFRVLCFEYRDDITAVFALGSGGAKVPVPLYTSDLSDIIKASFQGGKASFFIDEPQPDGKIVNRIVAEGPLATGTKQAFLLVPSDSKTGPTYHIVAFQDGEDAFPMGATRVINLSPFPVKLELAGTALPPIKPGGVEVYPVVKVVDEWNMYTARVQFGIGPDKWVDVATQSWKASERKRDWVIIRFDAGTQQPVIRQYKDIPPWRRTILPEAAGGAP